MSDYAPGVPSWVDVASNDLQKTCDFYSALFGWEVRPVPDPQAGGYTMFCVDGKTVAAAGPAMSAEQPQVWSTYVSTTDADATTQAVRDAGGQVLLEPMDVMGQGRMAVYQDPTGAVILAWQPQGNGGAELVNAPGSFCWSELYTRDLPRAKEFSPQPFGWEVEDTPYEGGSYTTFKVDGRAIAGAVPDMTTLDGSVPPHRLVYFAVEDTAATVAKAKELGATIIVGPEDTPMGPIAVLQDPQGPVFATIQFTPES